MSLLADWYPWNTFKFWAPSENNVYIAISLVSISLIVVFPISIDRSPNISPCRSQGFFRRSYSRKSTASQTFQISLLTSCSVIFIKTNSKRFPILTSRIKEGTDRSGGVCWFPSCLSGGTGGGLYSRSCRDTGHHCCPLWEVCTPGDLVMIKSNSLWIRSAKGRRKKEKEPASYESDKKDELDDQQDPGSTPPPLPSPKPVLPPRRPLSSLFKNGIFNSRFVQVFRSW